MRVIGVARAQFLGLPSQTDCGKSDSAECCEMCTFWQLAYRDYRSCLIDAWTALEIYVSNVLIDYYEKAAASVEQIAEDLEILSRFELPNIMEAVQLASVELKLKKGFRIAFGIDVAGDSKLWALFLAGKNDRNQCTHHGVIPTNDQAIDSLALVRQIIVKLETMFEEQEQVTAAE